MTDIFTRLPGSEFDAYCEWRNMPEEDKESFREFIVRQGLEPEALLLMSDFQRLYREWCLETGRMKP